MNLPHLAIRRPVFASVVFLILTLVGAVSFLRLPVDLMPDISLPSITVSTQYAGVGPEEMEELISIPMERALASTPAVKEIISNSSEGSSSIRISFEWGTDIEVALDDVRTRVDRARGQLPLEATAPSIFKFDVTAFPIMALGVSSEMPPRELREFTEKQIQYRFERIPGVAQADIWGGLQREIHVNLDRKKMHALRISPIQVISALRRENLNEPAGHVIEGNFELLLRTQGEYTTLDEIRQTMVTRREGRPLYISDLATVHDSHSEIRNLVRVNGQPGLRMAIRKQSGGNTVEVSRLVAAEVERLNRDFPHIRISTIFDSAVYIERAVANVRNAAVYGSILAVFVLLLFLRNLRSTLVIGIAIPISVIATFGLMYFYGFTLNTVTFGGLALGVGVLLDNSIVVLENIFRHRQDGKEKIEAARTGASEVAAAITAATLTTVVVFLPVVFMAGVSGVIFQQLAWVVSFALFSSLAIALTLVPLLASRFIRVREPNPKRFGYRFVHGMQNLLDNLDRSYSEGIRWSLRHRWIVVGLSLLAVGSVLFLVQFIGFEFQPEADEGEVRVSLDLPEGTRLDATNEFALRAEEIVRELVPEATNVLSEVGSAGGWRVANTNTASIRISLAPQSERRRSSFQIADALRPPLEELAGVIARTRASGGNFVLRLAQGGGDAGRLSLDIRGYDLSDSYRAAVELRRMLEATEGVSDARVDRALGRAESRILVDREKAATMGLSVSEIATTIRTALGGTTAGYFRERGDEYDIRVRFQEGDRLDADQVAEIPVQTPGGMVVPLHSLVRFERSEGPVSISRKDQQRVVSVSANLSGTRDMGSIVNELQERIAVMQLPPDTAVLFSGDWEDQQEAFAYLQLAFILAIVLVYLVMAAQFESFKYPFLIMFSLPLASTGVVLMLFITGTNFNMQAFIGLIMLVGIVVNNAIVLVDYVLQLQRIHGLGLTESLITGGRRRLRPIMMTTATTVLALTPMALGVGEGGELQAPMARVLIGGLLSSSVITLFLIPTFFYMMETVRLRRPREVEAPAAEPALG
jgi:hydrophobic/amphiphilic exporter-1 (mainly G- bacteria), HAE1 family